MKRGCLLGKECNKSFIYANEQFTALLILHLEVNEEVP